MVLTAFEFIFWIAIAGMVYGIAREFVRRADRAGSDSEERSRVEDLERRIRVLEKIVTDDGYDLKRKFKELEEEDA